MFKQKPAQIIVRNYESRSQGDAGKAMAKDANKLAKQGYVPVSQSWQAKGHSIKSKVALGLFVLATRSGKGTLTVTYQLQSAAPVFSPAPAPVFSPAATEVEVPVVVAIADPVITPVQPVSSPTGWKPIESAKPVIVAGSPEDTWR